MSGENCPEVTKIYSVSGMLPSETPFIVQRPFRAPHHTISHAGLVGGGRWPRPGEITLAHRASFFSTSCPSSDSTVWRTCVQKTAGGQVPLLDAKGIDSLVNLCSPADHQLFSGHPTASLADTSAV